MEALAGGPSAVREAVAGGPFISEGGGGWGPSAVKEG